MANDTAKSAQNKLMSAIYSGRVRRAVSCEECGRIPRYRSYIEGHHDDYSRPLDVRWLCKSCHTRHHVAERRARKAAA